MVTVADPIARAVAKKLNPINIGSTIDKMHTLREAKRKLEAQIKELDDDYADLEELLLERLDSEGTRKATGKFASASITEAVVGNVTDWDKVHAYIKKTGFTHLYFKRLSDPGLRELFEQGKKIPGCEPFIKRKLNLRVGTT